MKVNTMKTRKVNVDKVNFVLGKNRGYIPSSLGSRLIAVVRQVGRQAGGRAGRQASKNLTVGKIFKI